MNYLEDSFIAQENVKNHSYFAWKRFNFFMALFKKIDNIN